jgi:hypothetical protein
MLQFPRWGKGSLMKNQRIGKSGQKKENKEKSSWKGA